jgi:WD40 repeat protein
MVKMILDDPPQKGLIKSIQYSPDVKYIVSGGKDMLIRIHEVDSGRLVKTLAGHGAAIESVVFSPDGKYILSGSEDKTVKLWDIQTGQDIITMDIKMFLYTVAFSPDGRYFACGAGQRVMIWEIVNRR